VALAAVLGAAAALWPSRQSEPVEHPARADGSGLPALAVTDLQLGRGIGLDKRVVEPTEVFAPNDTIYASVVTEGTAEYVRLTARWRRDGNVVAEVSQGIEPSGTAVSEFNMSRPRGFAPGEYEVEILVDGAPAGGRRFTVK
jgi:hypothetical protein